MVPWSGWAISVIAAILLINDLADGALAHAVVMLLYFVCNFCLFLSIVHTTISEKVMIATIILTNVGITLSLQLFARVPALGNYLEADQVVWSPAVSMIVLAELLFCVLCFWTSLRIQKRKKDLV